MTEEPPDSLAEKPSVEGPDRPLVPTAADARTETLSREVERLRLLASRERSISDAILTQSPHGVIVSDPQGKLVLQNKAAERIWAGSASAESVEAWGQYRAFHPDGRPFEGSDWSMARALASHEVTEAEEIHFQRFDGTHGVMVGSSAPIFGADGTLEGALSVFTDITRIKQQEDELRLGAERYLTTLRSIGDAVIATDAAGRITFLNPIAEALTRWSLEDALGRPLSEVFRIVNEHTRDTVDSPVDLVIRHGTIVGMANHTLLIGRDGTEVAIDDSGAPIFGPKRELAGVVLVFRDVSEKRREEDRRKFIAEAGALLASSLDYLPTLASAARLAVPTIADWCAVDMLETDGSLARLAVAHVDPEKVRWATEIEAKYPPDPASPYSVHEVIRTGVAQMMPEIPHELLVQGAVDEEHLRLIEELGLKSSIVVPLRARSGILGAVTFVSSEGNRRYGPADLALAEELASVAALAVENARLYREAQNANRTKDEFLAMVSHELRTPLNAILGWATLLRGSKLTDEKRAQALETIERNARAQSQLIEDLLDVSRIISGKLRLDLRAVDLGAIIEAALDAVRLAADAKGVRIELLIEDEGRQASGDAGRLQQIVWNLLSNAVKFTERGGLVTVRLLRADSQAEIRVTDTGRGIEPEFLPHIFERFKQGNASLTRMQGGLGIGLAIVKHLVELHGGTVSAASSGARQGASFRVRLPLAAVALKSEAASGMLSSRIVAPTLDGLHVLVVDDEADARTLIVAVLEGHGARVTAVGSAEEAMVQIAAAPPDVLVSDIGMPEEDGYSLIRRVRASTQGTSRPIPAVALTAFARMEDRTRAMFAGFQSHVSKPVEPVELLMVVATLAGRTGGFWTPQG